MIQRKSGITNLGIPQHKDTRVATGQPTSTDRMFHALIGRYTGFISPDSMTLAWVDWFLHLSSSPGKQQRLVENAARESSHFLIAASKALVSRGPEQCVEPLVHDQRFKASQWQNWPFCSIYQGFLIQHQWWNGATTGIGGMSEHHQKLASFFSRQLLDVASPSNFIATNPEVLEATWRETGQNLLRGWTHYLEDIEHHLDGSPPQGSEFFRPGVEVAVTPGEVVFRNDLMELIQYSPQTEKVFRSPLLLIPAWIMKYYILDLSPHNSLVRYLVERGHTVYMISWRNPTAKDRDLGMDDYFRSGALAALEQVRQREECEKVHAVGYCLGGTLLAILASWLAHQHRDDLASVTLLAAQTNFTEPGELGLFIDESQLDFLDDVMWDQGYLDSRQMSGAFQLLRSRDVIWSRIVKRYLLGEKDTLTDLMAWNADATRMPYRMQSEYLRRLFLGNDLFEGRYRLDGHTLALGDIRVPSFLVATETDYVAPWRSVYKFNLVVHSGVTFLLTSGGHNAGICSEPGHLGRRFRYQSSPSSGNYVDPDVWYQQTPAQPGSWWPIWADWLEHGQLQREAATLRSNEAGLPAAPGTYVMMRNERL
jgi:polyhydroxyalkanoate synthase